MKYLHVQHVCVNILVYLPWESGEIPGVALSSVCERLCRAKSLPGLHRCELTACDGDVGRRDAGCGCRVQGAG